MNYRFVERAAKIRGYFKPANFIQIFSDFFILFFFNEPPFRWTGGEDRIVTITTKFFFKINQKFLVANHSPYL